MALAYDATGASGHTAAFSNTATVNYNHTAAGGATCLLAVDVAYYSTAGGLTAHAPSTLTATYGGTPMTLVATSANYDANSLFAFVYSFILQGPSAGTASVSVNATTSGTCNINLNSNSVSYTNCSGVTGAVTHTDNLSPPNNSPNLTVTGATSNQMVHCAFGSDGTASNDDFSGFTSGTTRYNWVSNGSVPILIGDAAGGSTVTFTANSSVNQDAWGGVGYILLPSTIPVSAALTGHGALTAVAHATKFVLPATPSGRGVLSAVATSRGVVALSGRGRLICSTVASGPVAYDATGSGQSGTSVTNTTPVTWTHTIAGNTLTVVLLGQTQSASVTPTFTVQCGSTSLTQLLTNPYSEGANPMDTAIFIYGLSRPPTGLQTITVTPTAGNHTYNVAGTSLSYYNGAGFGNTATYGGGINVFFTGTSSMNVSSAVNQMVVQGFSGWAQTLGSYNQTQRFADSFNPPMILGDAPGASTVTFSEFNGTRDNITGVAQAMLNLLRLGQVSATPQGRGALTGTARATKFILPATLSGRGVLSAQVAAKFSSPANLTGAGALTAVAHATEFTLTATLTGHGVVAAVDTPTLPAVLHSTGALTAVVKPKLAATLTGHGVLTATAATHGAIAGVLHSAGALTATVKPTLRAVLSGRGALTAIVEAEFTRPAVLSARGALTAGTQQRVMIPAHLTAHGALTVTETFPRSAVLSGRGVLSATARQSIAARLTSRGVLTAAVDQEQQQHANLHGAGVLSARITVIEVGALSGFGCVSIIGWPISIQPNQTPASRTATAVRNTTTTIPATIRTAATSANTTSVLPASTRTATITANPNTATAVN